jgi:hypothetical protein
LTLTNPDPAGSAKVPLEPFKWPNPSDEFVSLPIAPNKDLGRANQVCGVTLAFDRPLALGAFATPSGRAAGFPVATSLEELRRFDDADIRANLALWNSEQLAKMKLAAHQEVARLAATIDVLRRHLFRDELGAAVPLGSAYDAAKDMIFELLKDAVPLWRRMEELGQGRERTGLDAVAAYSDDIEKAMSAVDLGKDVLKGGLANISLLRALKGIAEKPGLPEFAHAEAVSLLEMILGIEDASKGNKLGALEHGGKAAEALLPAARWLVPEDTLPRFIKWQAYSEVILRASDLLARSLDVAIDRSARMEVQKMWREKSLELASEIEGLKGKLADYEKLERLMADEPRCHTSAAIDDVPPAR